MEWAVKRFSDLLTKTDRCAVLCILSHGGDGFVYGIDGKQVKINCLLSHLDNKNCKQMMNKPKIVIVQACNGVSLMVVRLKQNLVDNN